MIESYRKFWENVFNFSDTSNRAEYWWPAIINSILGAIIIYFYTALVGHPIDSIYNFSELTFMTGRNLVMFIVWIANFAVSVRRLHDTDRSGWWILIQFVPLVGSIWFFILMVLPGKSNRWG